MLNQNYMEKYDKVVNRSGVEARVIDKNFNPIRNVEFVTLAPVWWEDSVGAAPGCKKDFDLTPALEEEWQPVNY